MRLDLVKDFSGVLERCFSLFIERLNGKRIDALDQSTLEQASLVFDRLLYFMCVKKYFALKLKIYQNPSSKSFVVVTDQNSKWSFSDSLQTNELLGLTPQEIIEKLQGFNDSQDRSSKKAISHIIVKNSCAFLLSGISINVSLKNQIFYIWIVRIKLKQTHQENIIIRKQQRLLYKQHYQNYAFLKQDNPSISLESYTKTIQIHSKTFQRNFKKYLGTSFYDYHIQTRLIESLLLLMFTSYSVSEIAYKCGYESYRGYLGAFNKHQNYTPLDYR